MPIPLAANQEVTQQLAILSQQMLVLSEQLTKSAPARAGAEYFSPGMAGFMAGTEETACRPQNLG